MIVKSYRPKRGLEKQVSVEGLTAEQRLLLVDMGLVEEYYFTITTSAPPINSHYVDACEGCDIMLEEPEWGEPWVPPPPHDEHLSYAASQGLHLFPFQEIGISEMQRLSQNARKLGEDGRGGVLLLDEMGLGKTIEAIAFVAKMSPAPRKVLVICPNTLKREWEKAVQTWLEVKCGACEGTGSIEAERANPAAQETSPFSGADSSREGASSGVGQDSRALQEGSSSCERCRGGGIRTAIFATRRGGLRRFKELPEAPGWTTAPMRWLMTNYETMRSKDYMEILQAFNPDIILFDEAHRLRNWEKKTARASRDLVADTEILMTGTPVVNHAGDLWSLVSRVSPTLAGNAYAFERTYVNVRQGYFGVSKFGVKNQVQLKDLLTKVAVQRKKDEVLHDLPPKVYREVPLEMEGAQKELYEQMERQLMIMLDSGLSLQATSVLAQLTRLRQLCCDPRILGVGKGTTVLGSELGMPEEMWGQTFQVGEVIGAKTEFLLEFLEDVGDDQVVIFSNFEQYISLIQRHLDDRKMSYTRLTGKEQGEVRTDNIEKFQRGEAQIILGTTQAGGEGVNLQVASKVVLLDRWWSPVRNEQAVDRLHRIGQKGSVQVILPHCVETIDDSLKEILSRKYTVINELRIQGATVELMRKRRGK